MNESPVIGITVSIDHGKIIRKNHDYLYVKKAYSETVKKAGGQPLLISPDLTAEVAAEICDAIIISGGDDIPPSLYGEPVEAEINQESAERIRWERRVFKPASFDLKARFLACATGCNSSTCISEAVFIKTFTQDLRML